MGGTKMETASAASVVAKEDGETALVEVKTTKTEILASIALACLSIAPLFVRIDPNVNVVLTACLTVYVGCHKSVKPAPPSETMSREHAMQFPIIGSAVLFSLFLCFKFLPKELVNKVLTAYFAILGVLALIATVDPLVSKFLPAKWSEHMHLFSLPFINKFEFEYTKSNIVSAIPSTAFCAWYVLKKHWLANNTLGLAFSIQGIEMLSLGSFKIGMILLAGLFVYDIFWVFCTPVMVSVAKSFDAPIKLLFPTGVTERPYSMLGLGDIVIPGIFVALALRFDRQRPPHTRHYFVSAFAGYFGGVLATIIVMNVFQAAQPALLYIVPGVIGFLGVHCLINGELQPLLAFDESKKEEEIKETADGSLPEGDPTAAKKDN